MSTQQYLTRYAEAAAQEYASTCTAQFQHVLVVPAFDEALESIDHHIRFCAQHGALLILVINYPQGAAAESVARTKALYEALAARRLATPAQQTQHPLLVPAFGLPRRQGVGLARKLGSDIALHLLARQQISNPWLYQTDADATLPDNYFSQALPDRGAAVFPHAHYSHDPQLQQAADLYDQHMTLYLEGLRYAESRYAFPTLGSTIAIHGDCYATVRGFPKRNAGEDFYLLNKAAKVANVHSLSGPVVKLQARLSTRVPFGTGPALQTILDQLAERPDGSSYRSYNPEVFRALRQLLSSLRGAVLSDHPTHPPPAVKELLTALGWSDLLRKLQHNYANPTQRLRAFDDWFDGLKTLRAVHALQQVYADVPLAQAQLNPNC